MTLTYILSKDILKRRRASKEEADVWLGKGGSWSDERISVYAAGSNDSGVSWVIQTEGKTIFHAGDLNNWYARFLSEDIPDAIIETEKFGAINPVYEEKRYLGELKDIRKLTDHFDIVMFPVDGRIGNGYTPGGRQFLERFKVGMFVPMHFIVSGFESAHRFKEYADEKNVACGRGCVTLSSDYCFASQWLEYHSGNNISRWQVFHLHHLAKMLS